MFQVPGPETYLGYGFGARKLNGVKASGLNTDLGYGFGARDLHLFKASGPRTQWGYGLEPEASNFG